MISLVHEISNAKTIRDYIYAGNGVVTLLSETTDKHHTYRFRKGKSDGKHFVFVHGLTPNGYKYLGIISHGKFKLTSGSTMSKDTELVRGAAYLSFMMRDDFENKTMKLYHEGVCGVCGRPLTNPESIMSGIGPYCRTKL